MPKISHEPTITHGVTHCWVASDPWALWGHERKPNIQAQTITQAKVPITHEDEKIALVLALAGVFTIWNIF